MLMLEHRLQILIDDERHRKLTATAKARGVSVATVVREAIDRNVDDASERRRRAGARILAADAMEAGSVEEIRAELNAMHARHDAVS
jgi:predicted DNA-binding protein